MDNITITNDPVEQEKIGEILISDNIKLYDDRMMKMIRNTILITLPDATEEEIKKITHRSVYDYWVYGNNITEELCYNFLDKTHEEKEEYITFRGRYDYIDHLNEKQEDTILLKDKYRAYQLLKEYYKRDIIKISDHTDYAIFEEFVKNHPIFVAKPVGLALSIGVHKVDSTNYSDLHQLFEELLSEGQENNNNYRWSKSASMVLEELIDQDGELYKLHPWSANAVRLTVVKTPDGYVNFKPRLKFGVNGSFLASAAQGSGLAAIDSRTGVIISDGFSETGNIIIEHPQSKMRIKGIKLPDWESAVEMCIDAAKRIPAIGYIGWDIVYSKNGWCIMEGNWAGEFFCQLCYGYGMKKEFEELIGWHPQKKYWWSK